MIHVSELTKNYGRTLGIDNISFQIPPGQIVGYLGPNGVGKSTTVKLLVGLLKPTRGNMRVAGYDALTEHIESKNVSGMSLKTQHSTKRSPLLNTCGWSVNSITCL